MSDPQKFTVSLALGLEGVLRQHLLWRKAQKLWAPKRRPSCSPGSPHSFSASLLFLKGSELLHPWEGHSSLLHTDRVQGLPPAWTSPTHPPQLGLNYRESSHPHTFPSLSHNFYPLSPAVGITSVSNLEIKYALLQLLCNKCNRKINNYRVSCSIVKYLIFSYTESCHLTKM